MSINIYATNKKTISENNLENYFMIIELKEICDRIRK